jgi:N-acetylmuramoyl-L-alanine amidase
MKLLSKVQCTQFRLSVVIVSALVLFSACAPKPYSATNKSYNKQVKAFAERIREQPQTPADTVIKAPANFVGTTNMSMRKPNFVILHHTSQNTCAQTLQTFTLPRTEVSAHYVICRDGIVYHMLNDYLRAHHAGLGKWGNVTDMNSCSLGIELDNDGKEVYKEAQIASLLELLDTLKKSYNIPTANFIAHADFAPTRKDDPGVQFPWRRLAEAGFGLWYDDLKNEKLPENFDSVMALRIVGYDVRDVDAAIRAFNRHYRQKNSPKLNEDDKKALFSLMRKVM